MNLYNRDSISEINTSLTYSDIGLVPIEISEIEHREDIDTSSEFLGIKLDIPVLSSPMESVTGIPMCVTLSDHGALGILNRFDNSLESIEIFDIPDEHISKIKAISVGIEDSIDIISWLYDTWSLMYYPIIVCLDTANCQNKIVLDKAIEIKSKFSNIKLIVGNIGYCNHEQYRNNILSYLDSIGVDAIRIGIGSGSMCSTSIKTGIGIGQVSSLLSCWYAKQDENLKIKLIADGGINSIGDICKALACGADIIMSGKLFAGTKETPGQVIKFNGIKYKIYRGSASYGVKKNHKNIEGEETLVEYKGSVVDVLSDIKDGLQSSMSYMNAKNLNEFREKAQFTVLSHSSYLERLPRI